jgi:hypothetical protein
MILKIFSSKKIETKLAFLTHNKSKMLIITLVLRKRQIFRRKLAKIAENCDHNIDPRLDEISPTGIKLSILHFLIVLKNITKFQRISGHIQGM